MKKITQLLTALAFCSLMVFISCGGGDDDDTTTDDTTIIGDGRLEIGENFASGTTGAPDASLDGDARDEWSGFSLTVTFDADSDPLGGTYSVSGVPEDEGAADVWGEGGDWTFANESGTQISFDGKTADLTATETSVSLTFEVPEPADSRVATFYGEWTFTW